jgi:UDP-2-acetamido-2,6-beta-L-arabino-hexul-4-ose reductase
MHVGITGASGFIGQNLAQRLRGNSLFKVEVLDGDVTDPLVVDSFTCHTLIHLAASNRDSDPYRLMDNNVLGTYYIARHCLQNKIRLLVAGSTNTTGLYGASKGICKSIIQKLADQGLDAAYLSLCNVYGPYCKPYYNSFASTILWSIANNRPYDHLIKDPIAKFRLIHVQDLCDNIEGLLLQESFIMDFETRNVVIDFSGANELNITIEDFCRLANDTTNRFKNRHVSLIKQTLDWYRSNASNKTPG